MDLDFEDDDLFQELSRMLDDAAAESSSPEAACFQVDLDASNAAYGDVEKILLSRQTNALAERGIRRKINKRKQSAVAALRGLPPAPLFTLLDRLLLPTVSESCSLFSTTFTKDACASDAAMTLIEHACSFLPAPIFCRHVLVSTMTLGIHLGDSAAQMMSQDIRSGEGRGVGRATITRDRLESLLTSRVSRLAAERIFGRPWAITNDEKNAMRFNSKQARKIKRDLLLLGDGHSHNKIDLEHERMCGDEIDLERDLLEYGGGGGGCENRLVPEERVFANAVIIMIPDSIESNIKSCKVFTSGVLHITGCLSIDEGLRVAGAVGQVVRIALGLPDLGPHPVQSVDVQMINTDFSLDLSIDRCALETVINRVPPPQPCSAIIPPSKHASIKLRVAGVKHGTVLVFTTGKIMMTGFKNWLDLRKAFEYTVDVITSNADDIRSEIKQQARVNLNTHRGRTNRNVGVHSPIMRLLPPSSIDLDTPETT